jgi:hypothetical protein
MKRFCDGEIIRAVVNATFLEKKLVYKITLSRVIVGRIMQEPLKNINLSLKMKAATYYWFCTEMDKSTYLSDTTQLSVFVSGIHKEINITDELDANASRKIHCGCTCMCCEVSISQYRNLPQKTFGVKRAAAYYNATA